MSILKEFRATLETVTPLFLGGAEPREEPPELRPPSIRGALRYWLRAVVGSVSGNNLSALKNVEEQVFGSASTGEGNSSPVLIRKGGSNTFASSPYSKLIEYKAKDGKTKKYYGLSYLLFAERSTTTEKERSGLMGEFDLIFSTKQTGKEGAVSLLRGYASLWLLTRLGGIGSRARRGAGNIQGKSIKTFPPELKSYADKYPLQVLAATPEELKKDIEQGIRFARKAFTQDISPDESASEAQFDILHPDACSIYVAKKTFSNWQIALNSIGDVYKNFRMERPPDHPMLKRLRGTSNNIPQPAERVSFGLPIPLSDEMILESTSYNRRSSPLLFRVVKLATQPEEYAILIIWFKSKFLPDTEKAVLIEKSGKEHEGNLPKSSLVETFLFGPDNAKKSSLQEKGWTFLEVAL